jgi:hypothetical protein
MREVPATVRRNALLGLTLRREFKRGGTSVGVARANQLSKGRAVSDDTIRRMVSYFARHAVDKNAERFGNKKDPSPGYVAWLLWGGDAGQKWANSEWAKVKKSRQKN